MNFAKITKIFVLLGCTLLLAACTTTKKSCCDGWQPLLGANTTNAWRTYRGTGFPTNGWVIEGEVLHLLPGGKGGELVSVAAFDNFELEWEWKLAPKANNGLKYLVTESRPSAPGHEYQMVDDSTMGNPKYQTATFYDVLSVQTPTKVKPIGEWNQSRLIIQSNHVEHWLNGEKVLAYELGSDALQIAIAQSKFKNERGFGDKIKGHLLLTNHKDEAWYRNLRLRELSAGQH